MSGTRKERVIGRWASDARQPVGQPPQVREAKLHLYIESEIVSDNV